jgi:hypothetical protein
MARSGKWLKKNKPGPERRRTDTLKHLDRIPVLTEPWAATLPEDI